MVGFGLISLFADLVYEGARSVYGPLLATLGASALVGLRGPSGYANVAYDLLRLAGSYRDNWAAVSPATAVSAEEVEEARRGGQADQDNIRKTRSHRDFAPAHVAADDMRSSLAIQPDPGREYYRHVSCRNIFTRLQEGRRIGAPPGQPVSGGRRIRPGRGPVSSP